jgi:hypothetical protein
MPKLQIIHTMSAINHIFNKYLIVLIISFVIFAFPQKIQASNIIFQDNFDNDSSSNFPSKWQFYSGSTCPNTWNVDSGILKININYSSCATDILPSTSLWNQPVTNYIFDVDMTFISGTDHNLVYRRDLATGAFWEIHFQSPGDFSLNLPDGFYKVNLTGNYENGRTYHVRTIINNNDLQILINNILVRDYQMNAPLPAGIVSLRAGVGGDPVSETWFDNIVVTSIDNTTPTPTFTPTPTPTPTPIKLNVPYINQNNPKWGNNIYDFANKWSPKDPWIKSWGCALTSAAMVFKYFGINKMPDGNELNPQTLNTWLKNQTDGYLGNGNVSWYALTRLSKLSKSKNNINFDALQYLHGENSSSQLAIDINNHIPDILDVGKHFVVGTGIDGDTFNINDPAYTSKHTLNDGYSNTFLSMRRFIPSHTDLSYIVITGNPDATITLTDKTGIKIGESYLEGLTNDLNSSLSNKPLQIYDYSMPTSGDYNVQLSSTKHDKYSFELYLYDINGKVKVIKPKGLALNKRLNNYTIHYDKNNLNKSYIYKKFVFNNCKDDIKYFCDKGDINNKGICNSLLNKLNDKDFKPFINELDAQKGKHINQDAYDILLWDINTETD